MDNDFNIATQDQLLVGNSDSILIFGCDAQQHLREFSKMVSNQLLAQNNELEDLIQDISNQIDVFQDSIKKKPTFLFGNKDKKRRSLVREYNDVLYYIDKMELSLKLQEAQIIKESKIFEELGNQLDTTSTNLNKVIAYGNNFLNQRDDDDSEDLKSWYNRLSKRIESLQISNTVVMQSKAQINLMLENNTQLVDRIVEAVSTTIPIWRNQITLLLGVEKVNQNIEIEQRMVKAAEGYISKQKKSKSKELDIDELLMVNESLKNALDELDRIEKRDGDIRLELNKSLR